MTDGPSVTVWLDPGKTTGAATWDYEFSRFASVEGDFKTMGEWLEYIVLAYDMQGGIEIGWERYIVTPANTRHGTAYWSLETIGMARWLCLKHQITILTPQLSSQMAMCTDDRLKMIGWHKPGKPHANDAARHLLRYMLKAGALPIEIWQKAFYDEVLND